MLLIISVLLWFVEILVFLLLVGKLKNRKWYMGIFWDFFYCPVGVGEKKMWLCGCILMPYLCLQWVVSLDWKVEQHHQWARRGLCREFMTLWNGLITFVKINEIGRTHDTSLLDSISPLYGKVKYQSYNGSQTVIVEVVRCAELRYPLSRH